MNPPRLISVVALLASSLGACTGTASDVTGGTATAPPAHAAPSSVPATTAQAVVLRMQIDGEEWIAQDDVFAAVHPSGYDRAIIIAGSLGKQAPHEQAFTLNLYGIDKPGRYSISAASINKGVIQFGDFSAKRTLMGGVLGYDGTVEVIAFSHNPLHVELRFQALLISSDSAKVSIRDGYFNYVE